MTILFRVQFLHCSTQKVGLLRFYIRILKLFYLLKENLK